MSKFLANHPTALEALILYDIEKWRTADRSYRILSKMIGGKAISEKGFNELYEKTMKGEGEIIDKLSDLRLCILSDVIDKKSFDESYEEICRMIGSKDIDYQDSKFWFTRFSSGNWNLDQKTFYDLPAEIIVEIVENLNIESQLVELLESVDHPLKTTTLKMIHLTENAMIDLLKATKPGTLEQIIIDVDLKNTIDQLFGMDQWKQAKRVAIGFISNEFFRHFHHFHHFEMLQFRIVAITTDDILIMKNVFSENAKFKYCSIHTYNKPSNIEMEEALGLTDIHIGQMSNFLNSHPTALEALILYDIEKWRTADRSYWNLCKMIGGKVISEKDFDEMFMRTIIGKGEILEDHSDLRLCILSDVIEKKSIEESYEEIRKMIGSIDYHDFEFWFNRFSSGYRNLDEKTFLDLPIDIVAKIVNIMDFESQMTLRKVCRGLRNIVDLIDSSVDTISFTHYNSRLNEIFYSGEHKDRYSRQYSNRIAVSSLKFFMKNRRLRLKSFEWRSCLEPQDRLVDFFNSLNRPLKITKLKMIHMTKNSMIALIKAAKPGTLEEIDVIADPGQKTVVDQLVRTDQWKQAKKVTIGWFLIDFSRFSRSFHQFESFVINAHMITVSDVLKMKRVFSENVNFKYCVIEAKYMPPTDIIRKQIGLSNIHEEFRMFSGRYDIPDSTDFLDFQIDGNEISVYRK
uniref:F-box domain-containing protein n=1 Tax=Caenorhabditis tropicalis TaxID=1561998 RepID=A0A1I7UIA5_9PELO